MIKINIDIDEAVETLAKNIGQTRAIEFKLESLSKIDYDAISANDKKFNVCIGDEFYEHISDGIYYLDDDIEDKSKIKNTIYAAFGNKKERQKYAKYLFCLY